MVKNRFNRLSSKEWLPFQKSWFKYSDDAKLYREHILFFTKAEADGSNLLYHGHNPALVNEICTDASIPVLQIDDHQNQDAQYVILDLRESVYKLGSVEAYLEWRHQILSLLERTYAFLEHRRFVTVFIPNVFLENKYYPLAWDMAQQISQIFSLKDEKVACNAVANEQCSQQYSIDHLNVFYCLNFRKDENSLGKFTVQAHSLFKASNLITSKENKLKAPPWFILKPAPRKKNEILHPAKYPEELVTMFMEDFTQKGDNVFDPMSGTGSTQVAALRSGRNAFGTELSTFFIDIARQRCETIIRPVQKVLFDSTDCEVDYNIINKDARLIQVDDFPTLHYVITSPPYWDMLNMKGAENQAKRIEKGLQTNYSENDDDLGNLSDYQSFLLELKDIYFNIATLMESGSHMTIVVKNIKKKGRNYPFAWDLSNLLMEKLTLLPEVFWCQDDINLAPYGYGNTFVSNTFHQYCLTFRKP